jgi:lipopolysaccharide transport system ATP-binding protein
MTSDISISVNNVSKNFKLFHEKHTTLYESFSSFFNRKKNYETLKALDNISFDVKHGEMFGIIGKNGSGKTTLLRLISNIIKPDKGHIHTDGKVIPLLALGLGFHPELTATTNIIQSSVLFGIGKKEISPKIDEIIQFSGLKKFADTKIKNFSAGMQMRLAFATAMQVKPDILVLDEVFAVGDLDFQAKCYDAIMSFKKQGKSIIFVSHDMNGIRKHCDRVLFLNKGKVESIGEAKKVTEFYEDFSKSHSGDQLNI